MEKRNSDKKNVVEIKDNHASINNRNFKGNNKEKFYFVLSKFQKNIKTYHNLTEYELGIVMILSSYQRFRDHQDFKSYLHYKGKRATNKDLQGILKINEKSFKNIKSSLTKKNVLLKDEFGMYLNEDITVRGKLNKDVKEYSVLYIDGVRSVYNTLVKEEMTDKERKQAIKDVGLVLSFLPFVNKVTNTLVDENMQNLTIPRLKEKLGLSRNHKLEERLGRINKQYKESTGNYLMYSLSPTGVELEENNKTHFRMVINPRITFSSSTPDYYNLVDTIEENFNSLSNNDTE